MFRSASSLVTLARGAASGFLIPSKVPVSFDSFLFFYHYDAHVGVELKE